MLIPKLRFQGFEGEYDAASLAEVSNRVRRKNSENQTDIPLTIASIEGLVDQRTYFGKTIASKDMSGYYLLKHGEFAYNKSYSKGYPVGSIKRLDKYEQGALSTLYICFALKENSGLDSDYLVQYFSSDVWHKIVNEVCSEGARNHGLLNVSPDDFFATIHHFAPTKEEQEKIAAFLTLYDDKINTQITKIEAMEARKRGLLQKIFSQEIRFKADDGSEFPAWEDVLLEEILEEYKEKNTNDGKYEHVSLTKEGVVPKTERYNRDHLVTHDDKEYRVTHLNDICYNPANLKFGVICRNKYGDSIFSPIYITFKVNEGYSPSFMEYLLIRPDFINYALQFQEGSIYERMAVKPESLLAIAVSVPSLPEQEKIARFMELIDQQIQIEKDKLEASKNVKKGLLQQMFV
jgi:type I restriction enzyme S subunit